MGRKTIISTSSGPTRFILATYGFDIVLPLVTILGAMFLIAYVMNMMQSQAHILPEPLGTLGGLYLQSRLYLMLTTLTVAGVIIWMIREFFEPILLRFTLTIHDAREYLLDQLSSDLRRIYWHQTWRPRINVRRVVFLDTVLVVFVIIILLAFGSGQGDELLKVFGLASPRVNMTGYYVDLNAKLIVRLCDRIIIAFQDLLAKIIKILWG
jgi:hypothetical protein